MKKKLLFFLSVCVASTISYGQNIKISQIFNLQSTLNAKAPLASPVFTGNPQVPNQNAGSDNSSAANTKYVDDAFTATTIYFASGLFSGAGTTGSPYALGTGIVGISNLSATGTPGSTTALFGDNTWKATPTIAGTNIFSALNQWNDATTSTTFNPLAEFNNTQVATGTSDNFSPSVMFGTNLFNGGVSKSSNFYITAESNSNTTDAQLLISYALGGSASANLLSIDRFSNFNIQAAGAVFSMTNGNFKLGTAGNKFFVATGTNASMGTATLASGTVTVATTAVTASSTIFLNYNTPNGTIGVLGTPVGSIINSTSFVINSYLTTHAVNTSDTSTVNWWIIN